MFYVFSLKAGRNKVKKILGYGLLAIVAIVVLLASLYIFFPESVYDLVVNAQRRSADLVKKEVQVDNHKIIYLEGGKGETIILLHGFGSNKDCWLAFAKYLKGYHLVIPDLPGFGESSRVPADNYGMESQMTRINRFAEVLKLDKFHMAGNSMGGSLTAIYGAKHPEKILTLALIDPAGAVTTKKSELFIQVDKGKNLLLANNAKDYDELLALIFAKPPPIPAPFKKIFVEYMAEHNEFDKKIWQDWQPEEFSLAPVLPLIQSPVLIIWGDQDKVVDVEGVTFLEKYLKTSRSVILKDTGHTPMVEKPEETAKPYLSFLKEKR